ncbi:IPP transferase-domain-containing protein [Paraphoma chrysanthemicola]|nr:IPP transferase-domain-containing protein [Paraphoma chrysanthemicola]
MQLYRGLPVITNKVTHEEMKDVPHHLLGCIGLEEETWTVGKFVSRALNTIEEIRGRGKLPILVGGTHYYTQSLLFLDALSEEAALSSTQNNSVLPILEEPTSVILAKLQEVDPVMAERWHPNERRKIQRSLEIYLRTGRPASQIYDEQRAKRGRSPDSSNGDSDPNTTGMRFPTLLLWVHADKEILNTRLDARVDKMLARGLLQEVQSLAELQNERESHTASIVDQTRGIWVSIGYKEFLDYQRDLTEDISSVDELEQLKTASIAKTQAATRQYAGRQIKWIRIKLLNALIEAGQKQNMFLLDGTDLSCWASRVEKSALELTRTFLAGENLPSPTSLSAIASEMLTPKRSYDLGRRPDLWQKRTCAHCGTIAVTENDWNLHVKSRAHRRAVGNEKKSKNNDAKAKTHKPIKEDIADVFEGSVEIFQDSEITK